MGRSVLGGALLLGCAGATLATGDVEPLQRYAASHIVADAVRNPGPVAVICVSRLDGSRRPAGFAPPLAGAGTAVRVAAPDGCETVDGVLRERGTGRQALAVTAQWPEGTGRNRASVAVFTSTGDRDLAAWRCTFRMDADAWTLVQCTLDAIT